MKLTTKGRFAVTAMIDLAISQGTKPVSLTMISARQGISLAYLEQLFGKLRRNNLVESVRGPTGGYNLARPCNKISVAEIVLAVGEPLDVASHRGEAKCSADQQSVTHDLWMGLNEKILDYLEGVTLQHLIDDYNKTKQTPAALGKKTKSPDVAAEPNKGSDHHA